MRGVVIENFPKAPGLPKDRKEYLGFVDDIYKSDAYHSLSIEGYSVTPALIERVQRGDWDPESRRAGPHRSQGLVRRTVPAMRRGPA